MFVGSGAVLHRETISAALGGLARFAPSSHTVVRASTLAYLASERLVVGRSLAAGHLTPVYLRKSDAEINLNR
jgi:tRNA threonylcarbamoyladenosine biosynthesis protein TsaB